MRELEENDPMPGVVSAVDIDGLQGIHCKVASIIVTGLVQL